MGVPRMRILTAIVYLTVAALLYACEQQQNSTPDIDPRLGLECFESYRASLPPGTKYEGIEKLAGVRLRIRIMKGLEVITIDCELNPDGTLKSSGK
jgi:hypothetical protein